MMTFGATGRMAWAGLCVCLVAAVGCGGDGSSGTTDTTSGGDTGQADAGADTSTDTTVAEDTSAMDTGAEDTGAADSGTADAESDAPPPFMWPEAQPLSVQDRRPLLAGSVADQEGLEFILDTLSQTIFVDIDVVGDDLFHQEEVTVGDVSLGDTVVKGRSMVPDEQRVGVDVGGLLGQAFFNERSVIVDYAGEQVYLVDSPMDGDAPGPPGNEGLERHESLYELPNLFPVIEVQAGDAAPVTLLADTSSRYNVITQDTFDAVDDGTLPRLEGFRFLTNFGEDPGFMTRLPVVRVGDVEVRDVEFAVVPTDNHLKPVLEPNRVFVEGYLGAPFWSRFVLGIGGFQVEPGDTEGGTKRFVMWGDGSEPEGWAGLWTRVGVEVVLVEGAVTVEMVYAGTAAEAAGVVVGDVLEAIDGVDVESLADARARLQGEAGEMRTLRVVPVDGDGPVELSVEVEALLP